MASEFVYTPIDDWISLPDLAVRKDQIVSVTFGELFTVITLYNGSQVKTFVGRKQVEELIFCDGNRVNGRLVTRKGEVDNGQ